MNALLRRFAADERVVLVESLAELPLPSPCSVRLLERRPNLENIGAVSMTRLVQEALRLRPDRLVVGEVRGGEANALCQSLVSGHQGVMTTLHADNPEDAIAKLVLLAGSSSGRRSSPVWAGTLLQVIMMGRGTPPRLLSVTEQRFVPSD
jgi:pilus assembly protein CpaF